VRRVLVLLLIAGCGGRSLKSIEVAPSGYTVEAGVALQASAIAKYDDGSTEDVTATASWAIDDASVATIDSQEVVRTIAPGAVTMSATLQRVTGSAPLAVTARASFALPDIGLYTQFEDRTSPGGYFSGELLHEWAQSAAEVELQLDAMQAHGVTAITFELRATDPNASPSDPFVPPACPENSALGLDYPQPAASDLANLGALLDELHARGMKMWLRLVNTHMEEQPPTNNQTWLTAILGAIGKHPALDLVMFEGAQHVDPIIGQCNLPAEPPLIVGPGMPEAAYERWAMGLAMAMGIPARQLSAECVVADYNSYTQQPNTSGEFTNNHFWWTITTEIAIFDALAIPASERTYALSLYEHTKCLNAFSGVACTDEPPHAWTDETLADIRTAVGPEPRIVAGEMGDLPPVDPTWKAERAYESLLRLMPKYGVQGGSFWRWTNFTTSEDSDPTLADAIKRRGAGFVYNPVEKVLLDFGGWHLPAIANGSFEAGADHWTSDGTIYDLSTESGEPEVPWRGTHVMRLVDTASATSDPVPAQPAIFYTTTAVLRMSFADDTPTATIAILYFQADRSPSRVRASDTFTFHRADAPSGFGTFPVVYAPPSDTATVAVQIAVAANGSSATLDIDDVR
jgi:hypothetical protein